jgi:hypothetical protein
MPSVLPRTSEAVRPEQFGAAGDGVVDDRMALVGALQSGRIVDGGGRRYAVAGSLQPASFIGLRNITIRQLDRSARNTLLIQRSHHWAMRDVAIDCNGQLGAGSLVVDAGLLIEGCSHFELAGVSVRNGAAISGIKIQNCADFRAQRLIARQFTHRFPSEPRDDAMQGIYIAGCSRFHVSDSLATDFAPDWPGRRPVYRRWSRGFTISQSSDGIFVDCHASLVDQGFDCTGSSTNRHIVFIGCRATDCTTVGFKSANGYLQIVYSDCISVRAGFFGFLFGAPTEPDQRPRDVLVDDCEAVDTGADGLWTPSGEGGSRGAPTGFRLMGGARIDETFPRNIRFRNARAVDRQARRTMRVGFASDVRAAPAAPGSANTIQNSRSEGHVEAAFSGFGQDGPRPVWITSQRIAGSRWAAMPFAAPSQDIDVLFDDAGQLVVRRIGTYLVSAEVTFAEPAESSRSLRVLVTGAEILRQSWISYRRDAARLSISGHFSLGRGDTVRIEVYQEGGYPVELGILDCRLRAQKISQ